MPIKSSSFICDSLQTYVKVKWNFLDEIHRHGPFAAQYVHCPQCPPLRYDSWSFRALEDPQCSYCSKLSKYDARKKRKAVLFTVLSLSTAIVTAYETNTQHDPNNNNAMLGVHASASAIIQYGKIGRKQVLIQAYKPFFLNINSGVNQQQD